MLYHLDFRQTREYLTLLHEAVSTILGDRQDIALLRINALAASPPTCTLTHLKEGSEPVISLRGESMYV